MAVSRSPVLNLNGYTDVPAGKIAAVVTYLEMRSRPRLRRLPPGGLGLTRITADVERFRALFRAVGEPWMWFSRAIMPDERLRAIIGHPRVESYALVREGRDIGLLELDFRPEADCELAYFGLVPEAIGCGAGRFLMNEAIRRAFRRPIRRLYVHTCSLDHPRALEFYLRSGFVAYRRAIEVADDPRLTGALPSTAAPQVPLIARAADGPHRVVKRPQVRHARTA
ncbi:MAG TPA: GNAT family N-acetyltransferase [Microvirga sp.]|nr:GNAT family N-acetyltransferase [Microvirga sp.]